MHKDLWVHGEGVASLPWRIKEGFKEEVTVELSSKNNEEFTGQSREERLTPGIGNMNIGTPKSTGCLGNCEDVAVEGMWVKRIAKRSGEEPLCFSKGRKRWEPLKEVNQRRSIIYL